MSSASASTQLDDVVRRDAGRHADGDAGRAVSQKVRKPRRQHDRLAAFAVIGRAEIDRVLVDAFEQRLGHLGQPAFGVAHRRRVIAVDIAEIALAVDQRIALREILRQAHQRVIDRDVAMRVEFADDVAHHARAFLVARFGIELELAHGVEDAAMHRLQPVAHVGQRARHDGGERVGEIALAQRLGEIHVADFAGLGWLGFAHADLSIAFAQRPRGSVATPPELRQRIGCAQPAVLRPCGASTRRSRKSR